MQINLRNLGLVAFCIAAIGYKCSTSVDSISLGPGVTAPNPPLQARVRDRHPFPHMGYVIEPLAEFSMKAKVLSRRDYRFASDADLMPMDLAVGWGNMSDEAVLQYFKVWQNNRRGYWSSRNMPISSSEAKISFANVHLIPADDYISQQLSQVRNGDLIELSGRLVRATRESDGWSVTSSMSRKDSGDGACELIWVESFNILSAAS